ncbi:hypothetical protein HNQ35_000241 [Cerasibacillus quisquiliarum]|uniref:Uncharacterized protein n=1 Tax=Cerasibacillus quisquiliarum TaxID=227865 RepID=A0A511UU00_9BACI|nr:hypothetical protein [Cerasibacillus quisquiliarum]MBB5145052.1 hypothetical protein [Cerasibacillus quisquiliarum]GEN30057.1 hypothetical protein CQU01_02950 [Cerasibacillus quisquiliarum]
MDRLFINNTRKKQAKQLINEMTILRHELIQLEQKLEHIQRQCHHQFLETTTMRKCKICHYTESLHY